MTKTISIIALILMSTTAHATGYKPEEPPVQEPPVVTPETPTGGGGGGNDWIGPLVAIVGVGIAIYAVTSQPKTSNCSTISNQRIYGADGKPVMSAPAERCQ